MLSVAMMHPPTAREITNFFPEKPAICNANAFLPHVFTQGLPATSCYITPRDRKIGERTRA